MEIMQVRLSEGHVFLENEIFTETFLLNTTKEDSKLHIQSANFKL